ncbi:uncharacterized protein LOC143035277 isoform X2 [Oratosquilla oratoria]|uniref:uncharacterized protein LOC143035277 isoform X2 n=1 Tax=Oratosquilla oratoria TaxID=337810 RepID=UPI003F76B4D5
MAPNGQDKFVWSSELDEFLIEAVRSRPFLWDVKDPLFQKKALKKSAYEEIAKQLIGLAPRAEGALTSELVKNRYNGIRTYYRRELKKVLEASKNGSNGDDGLGSRWEYFPLLEFLRDTITLPVSGTSLESTLTDPLELDTSQQEDSLQQRESREQDKDTNQDSVSSFYDINIPVEMVNVDEEINEADGRTSPGMMACEVSYRSQAKRPRTTIHSMPNRNTRDNNQFEERGMFDRRGMDDRNYFGERTSKGRSFSREQSFTERKYLDTKNFHDDILQRAVTCMEDLSQQGRGLEDGDYYFARHIACELRDISDPNTKSLVKLKIQTLLHEARVGMIRNGHIS